MFGSFMQIGSQNKTLECDLQMDRNPSEFRWCTRYQTVLHSLGDNESTVCSGNDDLLPRIECGT